MNMYLVKLLLIASSVAVGLGQEVGNTRDFNREVETLPKDEINRDKRGFAITPLATIPSAAPTPFLPFLRATIPSPLLSRVTAFLPPAQLVAAPVENVASPAELPAILSATAPLVANRAAVQVVAEPQRLTAPLLPVAPPTVASAPVVTLTRVAATPTAQIVPVAEAQRVVAPSLPAAPPTVASAPVVTIARYAAAAPVARTVPFFQTPVLPYFATERLTAPVVAAGSPTVVSFGRLASAPLPAAFSSYPNSAVSAIPQPALVNTPQVVAAARLTTPVLPASPLPTATPVVATATPARLSAPVVSFRSTLLPNTVISSPVASPLLQPNPIVPSRIITSAVPAPPEQANVVVPAARAIATPNFAQIVAAPAPAAPVVLPQSTIGVVSSTYFGRSPAVATVIRK